jgi:ribonuclease R
MQREASKYDNPVPSREFILEFLATQNKSMGHFDLCTAFSLTGEDEIEALRRRLIAMCRDSQLTSNKNAENTPIFESDLI